MNTIKLTACDLDGTLLTPDGKLPSEIFDQIDRLKQIGITFCVASGRQLDSLQNMFLPVRDEILFLAENGALVAYRNEILYQNCLLKQDTLHAMNVLRELDDIYTLLCTPHCAYYAKQHEEILPFVSQAYISNQERNLSDVAETFPVCKIAIYDKLGPENNAMQILPKAIPQLRIIQSGEKWLDISPKNVNKGNALKFILNHFGINKEECVAFGDHMNDYEMLCVCGHPYIPENAYPLLKTYISSTVPANSQKGVIQAIEQLLQGRLP